MIATRLWPALAPHPAASGVFSFPAIDYAHAIVVDAMTLMGEMLKQTEKNKGAKGSTITGSKREPVKDTTPTLRDSGITKRESSDAQALATIKAKAPELHERIRAGETTVVKARQTDPILRYAHAGGAISLASHIGTPERARREALRFGRGRGSDNPLSLAPPRAVVRTTASGHFETR